jgi:rSAM/selenodomain-associated transferase 2
LKEIALSVVVPTLEEESGIEETLRRLRAVLPEDGEIVVADGGSCDRTVPFASTLARVVRSKPGRGSQMNAGARAGRGSVLAFLHADAWLEEGALEEARERLRDPRVVAVFFRQRIESRHPFFRWVEFVADVRGRWLRCVYGDSGLVLRRETFEACGGFPEDPLFEDLGISAKLRRRGGRFERTRARIHVSARRWRRHGVLRQGLTNTWLTLRYLAGADPRRLAASYLRR